MGETASITFFAAGSPLLETMDGVTGSSAGGGGAQAPQRRLSSLSVSHKSLHGILLTILSHSSVSNARMVSVVTFPWAPMERAKAAAISSSLASEIATRS